MSASVGSGRGSPGRRALTEAQRDLDETRFEGERVAAGLRCRQLNERLREVGILPNAGLSRVEAPGG